jgi:hypothetical protein
LGNQEVLTRAENGLRAWRRLAVVGAAVLVVVSVDGGSAVAGAGVSLPARIGAPTMWTADERRSPIGPASVVFSGSQWWATETPTVADEVSLVGATSDRYRVLPTSNGYAGMGSVLSGDGRVLADTDGWVDLATGRRTPYPATINSGTTAGVPAAWAPDNHHVVIAMVRQEYGWDGVSYALPLTTDGLDILDIDTGVVTTIPKVVAGRSMPGWDVAYSPNGTRIAYQTDDTIHVITTSGATVATIPLTPYTYLAGKGAWTPDGQGLMVVAGRRCSCDQHYPVRWTLSTLVVDTGRQTGSSHVFDGAYAIRVLGRWGSVGPAVERYEAESGTPVTLLDDDDARDELIALDNVADVNIEVINGNGTIQTLLKSDTDGAETIDIANNVLAGATTRPGDPPLLTVLFLVKSGIVAVALVLVAIVVFVILLVRRRRRRHRQLAI